MFLKILMTNILFQSKIFPKYFSDNIALFLANSFNEIMEYEIFRNEISNYNDIQVKLFSMEDCNLESLNDFFESSIFQNEFGMNILVHNFLHIVDYKPQKIIILINCILNYIRVTSNEKITEVILEEITKTRPTCSRFFIKQ